MLPIIMHLLLILSKGTLHHLTITSTQCIWFSVSIKIPSEGVQLLDYIPLSESQLTQLLFNVTYNVIGEILISGQR